jgi:hypothetical protein
MAPDGLYFLPDAAFRACGHIGLVDAAAGAARQLHLVWPRRAGRSAGESVRLSAMSRTVERELLAALGVHDLPEPVAAKGNVLL